MAFLSDTLFLMDELTQSSPMQEPSQATTEKDTAQQRAQMMRDTQNFLRLMIHGFAKIFGEIIQMIFKR